MLSAPISAISAENIEDRGFTITILGVLGGESYKWCSQCCFVTQDVSQREMLRNREEIGEDFYFHVGS